MSFAGTKLVADELVLGALRKYWGYEQFRPRQQRIVRAILDGRDVCVIMPTGGGKSLCYQLPAALLPERTAIVVSPLIALMQDQVAQLSLMGIPSAFLNSTISQNAQAAIIKGARSGAYRLLYLSPERLARADTVDWLRSMPLSFFAIDEAHCISEWGHEFRPEYRQMSSLRKYFAEVPIAAFTASATQRVRHDIMAQLKLREPEKFIASFHRPNLHYIVKECAGKEQDVLLLRALRKYTGSSVIIYASTIKGVAATVEILERAGIAALPYHGKMDADTRRVNQEKWTSDEVLVMVGTNAFGLGINKAAVRSVIHLALPKSIEQYYQEAGRAGRDGLVSECLLLWQRKDAGTLAYFVGQIQDAAEKSRAWDRYHEIMGFGEEDECRHKLICKHFGESKTWASCGACDVCLGMPAWLTERIAVAENGASGRPASAARQDKPGRDSPRVRATMNIPTGGVPKDLREYLREWRRDMAKKQGMPAFIVMHDTTLEAICLQQPESMKEVGRIPGIGEKKLELYGREILDALRRFRGGARPQSGSQA